MSIFVSAKIVELNGGYALVVGCHDKDAIEFLRSRGYEGNGYTWHGLVHSIARLRMCAELPLLKWSPEADDLLVISDDRKTLERLAAMVTSFAQDQSLLNSAIENADPELME
jgi:hypothetical protein